MLVIAPVTELTFTVFYLLKGRVLYMHFSLNAILMFLLGVLLILGGGYFGLTTPYLRVMAVGMFFTGIGCIFCSLTDGFSDPTTRGIAFRKLGYIAFILGLPVLAYSAYRFL